MATYLETAYDVFSWCGCLIVNLVFSHLGFWSGDLFLIAHFPDRCLLVPFYFKITFDQTVREYDTHVRDISLLSVLHSRLYTLVGNGCQL